MGGFKFAPTDLEAQIKALRFQIEVMQGALAAKDIETIEAPGWARCLTPQQRTLMGVLIKASPHAVSPWAILDCLPSLDRARDRDISLVKCQVGQIRKRLGAQAIETVAGGYRLGRIDQR